MCIMSQKIGEIAEKTNIARLQGSVSVDTAMEVMDMYEIDIVAVECEDDFAGVFSRGDFTKSVIRQNLNPKNTTLYEVMALNPPSVEPDASVKETYEAMLAYQWDFMPVLEGRKLCGIVSIKDIGQDVIKSFEEAKIENKIIMNYIRSGESYGMADYEPKPAQVIKTK